MMDEVKYTVPVAVARQRFDRARTRAFVSDLLGILSGRREGLVPFEEVRQRLRLRNRAYQGLQDVPLDRIVGSLGRYQDFTREFLPRNSGVRQRWMNVLRWAESTVGLPPVELYKVGEAYFVKDGNHRVSVARAMGAPTIQAYVWEYETRVPITAALDVDELIRKQESLHFLERTGIDRLCPDAQIDVTVPGGYRELEEHIDVHRYYRGLEAGREIPHEEAVLSWYDHVYMPVVQAIRRHDILEEFPGRTETDLYLWIMQHLHFLRERYGDLVSPEAAALDLAERYPASPMKRWLNQARRQIQEILHLGEAPVELILSEEDSLAGRFSRS